MNKNMTKKTPVKKAATKTATQSTAAKKAAAKAGAASAVKKTAAKAPAKKVAAKIAEKKSAAKAPARAKVNQSSPEAYVERQLILIKTALEENKAEDMLVIDLRGRSALADYFVVASGRSNRQVGALGDYVEKALAAEKHVLKRREGSPANDWLLLDTGDIIVHLFRPEVREYYQLEKMWEKE